MTRKRLYKILGLFSAAVLLALATAFPLIRGLLSADSKPNPEQNIFEMPLCDLQPGGLCLVTFGAISSAEMAIVLQTPGGEYPAFYLRATHQGVENTYPCEAGSLPNQVICVGARTPLGEPLEIKVFTNESDLLIASGKFNVSAMATTLLGSNSGFSVMGKMATPTPSPSPSPSPTVQVIFTPTSAPIATMTSTPDVGYPNP